MYTWESCAVRPCVMCLSSHLQPLSQRPVAFLVVSEPRGLLDLVTEGIQCHNAASAATSPARDRKQQVTQSTD